MGESPKISIIIPVYNVQEYLNSCIDSILNQSFTDFELILIDDGSTDGSGDICNDYQGKDFRIRVIHQSNLGVSSARNRGIDEAKGEYICFIDSDDLLRDTYLDDFGISEHIPVDTIYIQGVNDLVNGTITRNEHLSFSDNYFVPALNTEIEKIGLFHNGYIYNKLYNKSLIDKYYIRFNPELNKNEDHIFNLDYFMYIKYIQVSSQASYIYRHRSDSLRRKQHPYSQCELILRLLYQNSNRLITKFFICGDYENKLHLFSYAFLKWTVYSIYKPQFYMPRKERIRCLKDVFVHYNFLFSIGRNSFKSNLLLNSQMPLLMDSIYFPFFQCRHICYHAIRNTLKKLSINT